MKIFIEITCIYSVSSYINLAAEGMKVSAENVLIRF